jgi:CheY-like chemotaxis protein
MSELPIPSVLVVDDSDDDRFIMKMVFKRNKIAEHLFEARNGQEALDFLLKEKDRVEPISGFPPVLILLDINMPRMNGFEFLEAFKELSAEHAVFSKVVVSMCSSSIREDDKNRSAQYDCVKGFITKPFDEKALAKIVQFVTG